MRNISVALTGDQIRQQTKTVTRRLGWKFLVNNWERIQHLRSEIGKGFTAADQADLERLEASMILQPVNKCMGLKQGENPVKIGPPIHVLRAERQSLAALTNPRLDGAYGNREARLEGFPEMTGTEFVEMFCRHMKCEPDTEVTRIEFCYLRQERCRFCHELVHEWVDPDWADGRVCLPCEAIHEPK